MLRKVILLPLLVGCLSGSAFTEGAVACTTADQCREKFNDMGLSGDFYENSWPTKGCFRKNDNVFFGTEGTEEEMSTTDLQGAQQERVWCDEETEEATESGTDAPTSAATTYTPTQQPTSITTGQTVPASKSANEGSSADFPHAKLLWTSVAAAFFGLALIV